MSFLTFLLLIATSFLSTPVATPGPPEATPEPPTTERDLFIKSYPAGAKPDVIPIIDTGGPIEMQPGEERTLAVGTYECCYVFVPKDLEVIWTTSPVEGVSIDDSGLLSIDEAVPDGTMITVTANRDPVGPSISATILVYEPETRPLVGFWRETAQITCGTGKETAPMEPIGELRFDADGTFSVTWHPFEIYKDYWGTYEIDPEAGKLLLTVESGNIPEPGNFDGEGTFEIRDDGSLVLRSIWLGSSPGGGSVSSECGHVFGPM